MTCGQKLNNLSVEYAWMFRRQWSGNMFSCNEIAVPDVKKDHSDTTDGCRGDSIPIKSLFIMDGTYNGKPILLWPSPLTGRQATRLT
jgi:hypothetical protein